MTAEDSQGRVTCETADGICTLTLDRAKKKNALTTRMYEQLVEGFAQARADDSVRVLLVQGDATVFTAGNDLGDFMRKPPANTDSAVFQLLVQLAGCEKPIVAAVCGPAVGVGSTMLLHCDFVVAGEGARFHMPFVDLGLCPEGASSYLLPRIAGMRRAAELLMLGKRVGATEAKECGLVTEIVADESCLGRASEIAKALASKPPQSMRLTKQLLKQGTREQVEAALHAEGRLFMERLVSDEAKAAFAAFFNRR